MSREIYMIRQTYDAGEARWRAWRGDVTFRVGMRGADVLRCSLPTQIYVIGDAGLPPWMLDCCSTRFLQEPRVDKQSPTQFFLFINIMEQL